MKDTQACKLHLCHTSYDKMLTLLEILNTIPVLNIKGHTSKRFMHSVATSTLKIAVTNYLTFRSY